MIITMEKSVCIICRLPAERRCSACGTATYCSPAHQKDDWKNHKVHCAVFKVSSNEKLGRHLIATRNIREGEIILVERPILVGPKLYSPPICLGCYKGVEGSYFCSKCGFPLCSVECENISVHRENECRIFARKGSSPKRIENYKVPHPLYQSILPLRCLVLRESCPEKWETLNTLEHHCEARRRFSEVWDEYQVNIVNFLRDWHSLGSDYTQDTVNRVIGFIEVNSFQIKTVKRIEFCGLFKLGGVMSHDCVPNTHHAFTQDGNLIIRSSVSIKKNQVITMSYVDNLTGTAERRQILEQSKYFGCDCLRCQDPTECGTFISGIKCGCTDGHSLLPGNPLDPNSPWICYSVSTKSRNPKCPISWSAADVNKKLEQVSMKLRPILEETDVGKLESQLSLSPATLLHPNHFLLLPIYKRLNFLLESKCGESKDVGDLRKCKEIAQKLLSVLNVLDPGLTRGRGLLLRQIHKLESGLLELGESNGGTEDAAKKEKMEQEKVDLKKLFELDNLILLSNFEK